MTMFNRATLAVFALLVGAIPAMAQGPLQVRVVAACGTVPVAYPVGSNSPAVQDVNGNFCTNASGGGGGNVTIVSPVGAGTAAAAVRVTQASDSPEIAVLGTAADAAAAVGGAGTLSAKERLMTTQLDNINTNIQGAVPCLNATAFNTNSYSNAGINPANCDLNGGLYVHPPANQTMNVAQINGVTPLMGNGATGTGSPRVTLSNDNTAIANWGHGATGATAPTGATLGGCVGVSAEQTAVTNGQMTSVACGLGGKQIMLPYTVKELAVRGKGTGTDTSAHEIIAAGSGSNKTYITSIQCANSSATNTSVTLSDSASSVLYLPATGGNNATFPVPLVTAAATSFGFTASTGVTTVTCNAQGYYAL